MVRARVGKQRAHAILLTAMLVTMSCSAAPATDPAEIPQAGGRVVHGVRADAITLQPILHVDITSRLITDLIYAKAARPDPTSGIVRPELAQWTLSADGLTYRWSLDPAATWSDGTAITAEDWLVGLKAIGRSRKTVLRTDFTDVVGFSAFAEGRTDEIEGVRIDPADPKRWTVTYARVFCPALARSIGHLLPRHVFGKYVGAGTGDAIDRAPENAAPPVASGPFVLARWTAGDQVVLTRNPRYWRGAPLLDEYVVKVVADTQALFLQLKSGELDRGDVDAALADSIRSDGRLRVHSWDGLTYHYIGWSLRNPRVAALGDVRVRRALAHAIDVPGMITALLRGAGVPVQSHHPPASWAFTPGLDEHRYDPDKAEELLRAAGFSRAADGTQVRGADRLRFTIMTVAGDKIRENVAQIAAEQFRRVGADVSILTDSTARFVDKLRTGAPEVEAWTGFWAPSVTDPDPYAFLGADQIPDPATKREGFNFGGFSDASAERAMAEGRTPTNGDCSVEARRRQYAAFDRIVNEQQPYVFLFAPHTIQAVSADLRGFAPGRFWPEWNVERWWRAR